MRSGASSRVDHHVSVEGESESEADFTRTRGVRSGLNLFSSQTFGIDKGRVHGPSSSVSGPSEEELVKGHDVRGCNSS